MNCWEFFRCGREPGGKNAEKLGVCPAATVGKNIVGTTMCFDLFGREFKGCANCEFFKAFRHLGETDSEDDG